MTSSTANQTTPAIEPVTDDDIEAVRGLIELGLQYFNDSAHPSALMAAGVTAEDLATNVRGWTHTTRLRDFVEATRKPNA